LKKAIGDVETRENKDEQEMASIASNLQTMEIGIAAWLVVLTVSLIVIVALVYKKYRSGPWNSPAKSPSTWSDAESGDLSSMSDKSSVVDLGVLQGGHVMSGHESDSNSDSVEVPLDRDSDVESLGSVNLDDEVPEVHSSGPAAPVNFRGATRATNPLGGLFTENKM